MYDDVYIHCRNADGKILIPAPFQSSVKSGQVARVEPNRKWFGKHCCLKIVSCNNSYKF